MCTLYPNCSCIDLNCIIPHGDNLVSFDLISVFEVIVTGKPGHGSQFLENTAAEKLVRIPIHHNKKWTENVMVNIVIIAIEITHNVS